MKTTTVYNFNGSTHVADLNNVYKVYTRLSVPETDIILSRKSMAFLLEVSRKLKAIVMLLCSQKLKENYRLILMFSIFLSYTR